VRLLKRIDHNQRSRWSFEKDDEKFSWLNNIFTSRYANDLKHISILSEFHSFLTKNEGYKYSGHFYRYAMTMVRLLRHIPDPSGMTILETGGSSPLLDFLAHHNDCYHTESDLRLAFDCPDSWADLILSLEVFEHLKDQPEKSFDEVVLFQGSGTRQFAQEADRCLKPGGFLILTTPNALAAIVMKRFPYGEVPMVFRPHVREYSKAEIVDCFSDFDLIYYESMYNFFDMHDDGAIVLKQIAQLGGKTVDRGDDHFFCFRKAQRSIAN